MSGLISLLHLPSRSCSETGSAEDRSLVQIREDAHTHRVRLGKLLHSRRDCVPCLRTGTLAQKTEKPLAAEWALLLQRLCDPETRSSQSRPKRLPPLTRVDAHSFRVQSAM